MTFIVSSYFIEVLGNEDVDLEMPTKKIVLFFLGKDLEKVDKTFFQSIGAKKSKISNKPEVLKREGVKISFSCKITFKI
jgi:hypothetical protein